MIGCLQTRVRKQPIIGHYFESANELKFYNLEASSFYSSTKYCTTKQGPAQNLHKTIGATINNDLTTTEQPPYDG